MYKSKLQELCQKRGLTLPVYTSEKDGPGHCPRFTAAVTVDGTLFHTPPTECRSLKEAQNSAARVAFEFLSAVASGSGLAALPSLPRASSITVAIGPAKEVPQQNNIGNMHSNDRIDVKPIELLHLYKNRLQQYVQKNHISHPVYASEYDGPPHCRRFKASVTIEGRTYQCSEYYPTLKDAEHAAAKVALESLSTAEIEESDGLFKSLLQQLVHKEGYQLPSYSTDRSGLSHAPTFMSTVVVGDLTFQGEECKTKKQSEMSAAKVAYEKLISLKVKVAPEELGKRIASPQDTPRKTADENCQNVGVKVSPNNNHKRTAGQVEGFSSIGATGTNGNGSASYLGCGVIDDTLQNCNSEHAEKIENGKAEGIEENAKRHKSSNECINHSLPATLRPSPPLPNNSSSVPDEIVKRRLAEYSENLDSKILISHHKSGIDVPEGASVVHSGEGWMAVKVNSEQDE